MQGLGVSGETAAHAGFPAQDAGSTLFSAMAVRILSASTWQRAISFFRCNTSSLECDTCKTILGKHSCMGNASVGYFLQLVLCCIRPETVS